MLYGILDYIPLSVAKCEMAPDTFKDFQIIVRDFIINTGKAEAQKCTQCKSFKCPLFAEYSNLQLYLECVVIKI